MDVVLKSSRRLSGKEYKIEIDLQGISRSYFENPIPLWLEIKEARELNQKLTEVLGWYDAEA